MRERFIEKRRKGQQSKRLLVCIALQSIEGETSKEFRYMMQTWKSVSMVSRGKVVFAFLTVDTFNKFMVLFHEYLWV